MTAFPFINVFLLLLVTLNLGAVPPQVEQFHTIETSSLFLSRNCKSSPRVEENKAALEVVNTHGPCSSSGNWEQRLKDEDLLHGDEARVAAMQSRQLTPRTDASVLPVKSGISLGTGNFVVKVGLGTPAKDLSLVFDTGSAFSWTQCQPCRSCYKQVDPIFDPLKSSTYSNVSCLSQPCAIIGSETGFPPKCSASTCVYGILYGDNSLSLGYLAREKLTISKNLPASDVFMGCAKISQGLFGMVSGLLGLGRSPLSVVTTTAQNFQRVFSYCLPSSSSDTGFLAFGELGTNVSARLQYTPISSSFSPILYGVNIVSISVGGNTLPIAPAVFSKPKGIIDSGTVISRLPPAAYSALRDAVKAGMKQYPLAPAVSLLDTCFDVTGRESISYPPVSFTFEGGAVVKLPFLGTFRPRLSNNKLLICFAFAANSSPNEVVIFGNTQQRSLEVVYDVARGRIGFASGGCS